MPDSPDRLGRAVDAAVGVDSDRAFGLLDKLAVWDRRGCACRTCRLGDRNLRLVLSAELDRLRRAG